jgi:hypothetical protein
VCEDPKAGTIVVSYLTAGCGKLSYVFPMFR